MTDGGLRSIKVSKKTYDALISLKRDVRELGMGVFPTELRETDDEDRAVSMSELIDVGVRAARAVMKRSRSRHVGTRSTQ